MRKKTGPVAPRAAKTRRKGGVGKPKPKPKPKPKRQAQA